MKKCTFPKCNNELNIRNWQKDKIKEREKDIGICVECWFSKLSGKERYNITLRIKEN